MLVSLLAMKKITILAAALAAPSLLAQTVVNLQPHFTADIFREADSTAEPSDLQIDATTLPANFTDGSLVTSTNGQSVFRFAPLKVASLDAVAMDGQVIDVQDGFGFSA